MKLKYNVSPEDYIAFNVFHHKHAKRTKQWLISSHVVSAVFFLLAIAIFVFLDDVITATFLTVLSLPFFFFAKRYYLSVIKREAKKAISNGEVAEFLGEKEIELAKDKMISISEIGKSETKYEAIQKIESDGDRLYVYIGGTQAFIISLSAFADIDAKNKFLEIIKEKSGVSLEVGSKTKRKKDEMSIWASVTLWVLAITMVITIAVWGLWSTISWLEGEKMNIEVVNNVIIAENRVGKLTIDKDDLEITSRDATYVIMGNVKNETGRYLGYIALEFRLFDKDGVVLEDVFVHIEGTREYEIRRIRERLLNTTGSEVYRIELIEARSFRF